MSARLASSVSLEALIRSHEWVANARQSGSSMLVVPNVAGVRMLRRHGKRHLVAAWLGCVGRGIPGVPVPKEWRLLETMPPPGSDTAASYSQPVRNPLVTGLQRHGACGLRCGVRVPYDLAIFDGHFLTIPILPGVVQVGWAVDLARTHLRVGGRFKGITATKFRRLVQPGMSLTLTLEHRSESAELRFRYSLGDALVSIGRVFFWGGDD